jgi:hypothetical protein
MTTKAFKKKIDIDKESVKVLVIAIGVKETAKKLGIPLSTICNWSAKGKWLKTPEADAVRYEKRPEGSMSPSEALRETLLELGARTKLGLSRALANGADSVSQMDGAEVLENAEPIGQMVRAASTIHGWAETSNSAPIQVSIYGSSAPIQVVANQAHKPLDEGMGKGI